MPVYTCDPNLEIYGYAVRALLENVNHDLLQPFLENYHITAVDPERWYRAQDLLDMLNDMARIGDTMGNFVAIGMRGAELTPLSPEVEALPFEDFMCAYGAISQSVYRGGDAGVVSVSQLAPKHFAVHFNVPHPDDLVYGLLYGFVRRMLPSYVSYTIYYDEEIPSREDGGPETIIHVVWDN